MVSGDCGILLKRSDFLTLHVKASAETHGLAGRDEFLLVKPVFILSIRQELSL